MKSRLDKILADNGFGSRRDIKKLLRSGALSVNGLVATDPADRADPETDSFALDGEPLALKRLVYLMLNKCAGVVTSTSDPTNQTVIDLLGSPWDSMGLFPVGRLDIDTEGLLLITNDGPLTHRLTSPKTGCDKTYLARLRDPVSDDALGEYQRAFRQGIAFHDGYVCLPASVEREGALDSTLRVVIGEGKYHQVKKMFKVVGNEVVYLKRVAMGPLALDEALLPGSFRELSADEISILREV